MGCGSIRISTKQMTDRSSSAADYLAAERTFLAWIRTGLALMGFGFVVARFGLFLQALQISHQSLPLRTAGIPPWLGTALISLGIVVNVCGAVKHVRLVQQLNRGGSEFTRPSALAIAVAIIFFAPAWVRRLEPTTYIARSLLYGVRAARLCAKARTPARTRRSKMKAFMSHAKRSREIPAVCESNLC